MAKASTTLVAALLAVSFLNLGGCATRQEEVLLIEPTYSYIRDVNARSVRLNDGTSNSATLTIAAELSNSSSRSTPHSSP